VIGLAFGEDRDIAAQTDLISLAGMELGGTFYGANCERVQYE
jgi:hypothetical protein